MKKFSKFLCLVLGLMLISVCFVGCDLSSNKNDLSYVSMRINPEIELVVDKDGIVVAANAINEDGETVLCEITLTGLSVEDAAKAFTEEATELGFIDVDTEEANVYILVDGKNDEFVNKIKEKITDKVNGFFNEKGIFGKVNQEDLSEFEELATEWGVNLVDAKMIARILELYPEITVEEILELSIEERIKLIKEDHEKNGMPAQLRDEYKKHIDQLKEEHSELFELAREIRELEKRIANQDFSGTSPEELENQLQSLKEQFESLKETYDQEVDKIKDEVCQDVEQIKTQIREKAQSRRDEFEDKLAQHEDEIKDQLGQIKDQINNWRKNHK